MREFFQLKWAAFFLVALIAVIHVPFTAIKGIDTECPDCVAYAKAADEIVSRGFNLIQLARHHPDPGFMFVSHLGFKTVVAATKAAFGSYWAHAILGFNLVFHLGAAVLIISVVRSTTKDPMATVLAGILFLVSAEILLWVSYVLTDTSYMALSFGVVCLSFVASGAKDKKSAWRLWGGTVPLAVLCLIYRPTGVLVMLTVLAGVVVYLRVESTDRKARTMSARIIGMSFIVIFVLCILMAAYIMAEPSRWKVGMMKNLVVSASEFYADGVVIKDRPWTYHERPQVYWDYVWLIVDRFLHFFAFYDSGFSLKHKILNILFFPLAYGLSLVAIVEVLRQRSRLSAEAWRTSFLCCTFILMTACFHSMVLIDFDWRFRLPCMPPLIVLAGIGAMQVRSSVGNIAYRRTHKTGEGGGLPLEN